MLLFSACVAALLSGAPESAVSASSDECLVALDDRGALVFATRGGADYVRLPPGLEAILGTPGTSITLRHNHPHSHGLSRVDLMTLAKQGVSVVEAIGLDGSVYRAARGPRFDMGRITRVYRGMDALAAAYFNLDWRYVDERARLVAETDHLACVALADAGVIAYTFRLSPAHEAILKRYAPRIERVRRRAGATR
jgi:hypothetical protein